MTHSDVSCTKPIKVYFAGQVVQPYEELEEQSLVQYYPFDDCAQFRNDTAATQKVGLSSVLVRILKHAIIQIFIASLLQIDPETFISMQTQLVPDDDNRGFAKTFTPEQASDVIHYCFDQGTNFGEHAENIMATKIAARTALCIAHYKPFVSKNEDAVACWVWNILSSNGFVLELRFKEVVGALLRASGKLPKLSYIQHSILQSGEVRGEEIAESVFESIIRKKLSPQKITDKELTVGTGQPKHIPDPRFEIPS
jgi:hypothetical protein